MQKRVAPAALARAAQARTAATSMSASRPTPVS